MCLVLVAVGCHSRYPLVVAANRDEFHERAADPAHWWAGESVLAGRDREAGGTWFAVDRRGRFAAVTNYRDPSLGSAGPRSRGELPLALLRYDDLATGIDALAVAAAGYSGFNLIGGDRHGLVYLCNQDGGTRRLGPGLYGLSNHVLDTAWPKVRRGRGRLAELLEQPEPGVDALLDMLHDRTPVSDDDLPDTGVPLEWERLLAPMFIVGRRYGTRASTVYRLAWDGTADFAERRFDRAGRPRGMRKEHFQLIAPPGGR